MAWDAFGMALGHPMGRLKSPMFPGLGTVVRPIYPHPRENNFPPSPCPQLPSAPKNDPHFSAPWDGHWDGLGRPMGRSKSPMFPGLGTVVRPIYPHPRENNFRPSPWRELTSAPKNDPNFSAPGEPEQLDIAPLASAPNCT